MKKILGIFLVIQIYCLSILSNNFIDTTKVWITQEYNISIGPGYEINRIWYAKFGGDTLVHDINYTKLEKGIGTLDSSRELLGMLRENKQKVYFRPLQGEEKLLFDFSLELNDTVNVYNFSCIYSVDLVVYKVDSILINKRYYKIISLQTLEEYDRYYTKWIEYLGESKSGIFQQNYPCAGSDIKRLLCFSQNNKLVFNNTVKVGFKEESYDCTNPYFITDAKNANYHHISVYPNPVSDRLVVKNITKPSILKLYNMQGQIVTINKVDNNTVEIQMEKWSSGIYHLSIETENNCVYKQKIIKH